MDSIWKRIFNGNSLDYRDSPYANPRKPYVKPYNEMSRLEQRIHRTVRYVSWLAILAGAGVGVILVLIIRALTL